MDIVNIFPDTIWSIKYEGEDEDCFSKRMKQWLDPEFIDNFFERNKHYIENNPHYEGYTVQDVKESALKEAKRFLKDLNRYYKNGLKGLSPDFEDKFVCYYKRPSDAESEKRRKLYGYTETDISPIFRLYGIRVDSEDEDEQPGYVVTGGGMKVKSNTQQDAALNREINKMLSAQEWLKRQGITTKEKLIVISNENTD